MSKASLTASGGFLWITCVILLAQLCFMSPAIAVETKGRMSHASGENNFIQIRRSESDVRTKALPKSGGFLALSRNTSGSDNSKRQVAQALRDSEGATIELASLDTASDTPVGMRAIAGNAPFKQAQTPRRDAKGMPIKRISLTMGEGNTSADGDEEEDEGFYSTILRPQKDRKKFLSIMRKQGFVKLKGVKVVHGGAGEHGDRELSSNGRGVLVTRPGSGMPKITGGLDEEYESVSSGNMAWRWPVAMTDGQYISSGFGHRIHPVTGKPSFHQGIDIAAPIGTNVMAAADGVVSLVTSHKNLGRYVRVEHPDGSFSLYGHLSQQHVEEGQPVRAGQVIGAVGTTGRSTGPHLDFSLRMNDTAVNPLKRLKVPAVVAERSGTKYLSMR